eukprot:m.170287 g.170287  ORF g.170287 m.170287 type:complete len:861 (-) comp14527_c2_seq4:491-3073(-)
MTSTHNLPLHGSPAVVQHLGKGFADDDSGTYSPFDEEVLNEYDIGETLGVGTQGEVKRATHKLTKQEVAIKIISSQSQTATSSNWSEVAALKSLRHPHVVRLYDVIPQKENTLLVLECLTGGELFDYLVSRHRLSESEGRRFIRQIMQALSYCHSQGIVHRDLKLENLLLDSEDNIKVTDFGFSNVFLEDRLMSTFVGSPAYCAPEIIANEKYSGPKADIWSLGVIIYTLLAGDMPFKDDNAVTNLKKINTATYEMPPFLSDSAKDLLERILKRDPEERLTMEELWEHPWVTNDGTEPPVDCDAVVVDEAIHKRCFDELEKMGLSIPHLHADLVQHRMSKATASYHLLYDKLVLEAKESEKDDEIQRLIANLRGMTPTSSSTGTSSPSPTPFLFLRGAPTKQQHQQAPEPAGQRSMTPDLSRRAKTSSPTHEPQVRGRAQTLDIKRMTRPSAVVAAPVKPIPRPASQKCIVNDVDDGSNAGSGVDEEPQSAALRRVQQAGRTRRVSMLGAVVTSREVDVAALSKLRKPARTSSEGSSDDVFVRSNASSPSPSTPSSRKGSLVQASSPNPRRRTRTFGAGLSPAGLRSLQQRSRQGSMCKITSQGGSANAVQGSRGVQSTEPPGRRRMSLDVSRAREMREANQRTTTAGRLRRQSTSAASRQTFLRRQPTAGSSSSLRPSSPLASATTSRKASTEDDSVIASSGLGHCETVSKGMSQPKLKLGPLLEHEKAAASRTGSTKKREKDALDLAMTMRSFGAATTSSKPAHEIISELKKALRKCHVFYEETGPVKLRCSATAQQPGALKVGRRRASMNQTSGVVWEMDVQILAQLGLRGIRLHRVTGNHWEYKTLVEKVINAAKL